jgi:hypothetical protein
MYEVDYDALDEHGTQLGALRDEFNGIEDNTEGYVWAIGSGEVSDALRTFASNWSDKRGELAEALDGLSQCAIGAADGYCSVDTDYASAISGDGGGSPSGGNAPVAV